jgi:tRNA(Arg) A34 adenosine deaminase TadA
MQSVPGTEAAPLRGEAGGMPPMLAGDLLPGLVSGTTGPLRRGAPPFSMRLRCEAGCLDAVLGRDLVLSGGASSVRRAQALSTLSLYRIGHCRLATERISYVPFAMNSQTSALVDRLLTVLREDVLPMTQAGVREGSKVFGAAVLSKASLALVVAGPNEEARNPLLHGEISCLNRYWSLPRESRPPPADCLFLSSHEPCPMCLAAIAWSGFDNFYYLFSYENSRDEFQIPHDLAILEEIFRCSDGAYAGTNAYWTSYYLLDLVDQGSPEERARWQREIAELRSAYGVLSDRYQEIKRESDIPLA